MKLDLKDFYSGNKLISDYLNGETDSLISLPYTKDNIFEKARKKDFDESVRTQLVDVLLQQNSSSKKAIENIEKLKEKNSFTITTGHQLNIFSGPLFFIYKILQTINITEELNNEQNDVHFVPVYWMASEDHDFEEIASVNIFNEKFEWKRDFGGPVGRFTTEGMPELWSEISEKLNLDKGEVFSWFEEYVNQKSLSDATRLLCEKLFADFGLVVLDADDSKLKSLFQQSMLEDLAQNKPYSLIHDTISYFDKKNYKVQVNPREINLFYLYDDKRGRIKKQGDEYQVLNSSIKIQESCIVDELKNHPEKFSPNVVLRPMYQETILPNIAYLGGAGEISYWLEFKSAFDAMNIDFPLLIVRNSLILIDAGVRKKLDKLNLSPVDFLEDEDELIRNFVKSDGNELDINDEVSKIEFIEGLIAGKIGEIDRGLESSLHAQFAKFYKDLEKLEGKVLRSLKQQSENEVNAIRAVKKKFFPNGVLQERYENILPLLVNFGPEIILLIKENIGGLEQKMTFTDLVKNG